VTGTEKPSASFGTWAFPTLDLSKCRSCCSAAFCGWTTSARSAPVHRVFLLHSYDIAFVRTRGEERATGAAGFGVFCPTTLAVVGGACAVPPFSRNFPKFLYEDDLISIQAAASQQTAKPHG